MKKILLALLVILPFFSRAQVNDSIALENRFLKNRIDSLESKVDEKYYTRIPNKDLDDKLNDAVNKQVGNYISGKIALASTIIGVISFLLGYLAKYFYSESTRKQIEENVKGLSDKVVKQNEEAQKKLDILLNEQKEFISTTNKLNDDRIKDLSFRFDNLRTNFDNQFLQFSNSGNKRVSDFESNTNTRLKQFEEQLSKIADSLQSNLNLLQTKQADFEKSSAEKIETQFTETFDFLWGDIISGMIDRAVNKKYTGQSLIDDFEKLLNRGLKVSKDLQISIIDTLMRCYFNTLSTEKKYDKMVELIRNYEDKYDLTPETYLNAAIALEYNYELFGTPDLRDAAIANCDKSIQKNRDYGEPYAVKMEILSIALLKTRDDEAKTKIKHEIEDLLFLIDRIHSQVLKAQILQRLFNDKAYLVNYIEGFYKDYAAELTQFREYVVQPLIRNYAKTTDKEKKLLTDLLQEGLALSPNIDGEWVADLLIESGSPVDATNINIRLTLKGSTYSISNASYNESGIIYFLPHITPSSFALIPENGDNIYKITRGIFDYEPTEPKLTWCINSPEKERPAEFVSTKENQFKLLAFTSANKTKNAAPLLVNEEALQ